MFSVYFDNVDNDDEFGNANGQLTLGGLPARETYEGEIQWAPRYEESLYKVMNKLALFQPEVLTLTPFI